MKSLVLVFALQATLLLFGICAVVGDDHNSGGNGDFADFKDASPAESIRIMRARLRRGFKDSEDSNKNDKDGRRRSPPRERRESPSGTSRSLTELKGVLRVVVIGNGDMCFVKVFQNRYSYREQYGDTTSTSAFIDLYGHGECEPGATGIAFGYVRASVVAIANKIGPNCEAKVTSYAIAKTQDLDPNDGVSVAVGGAAGGEALALCP